jgi:PKD repeat protein
MCKNIFVWFELSTQGGMKMLSHRCLRTFILFGIVFIFTAGCRTPVITFPSSNITIDAGDSISFTSETYPNAIYKWTFDGGAKDELGQNPTVQFNKAGVYRACLVVVFEDLDSGIASLIVTVNGPSYGALVEKTGQTSCYDSDGNAISCTNTGHDGDIQAGVTWPNPRFTDNSDGTVTDNLTGLIWLKNANCGGLMTWAAALNYCQNLASGSCGLTDGSGVGDWRLPNVKELQSLIHWGYYDPSLPNTSGTGKWTSGDPFTNVQSSYYWSATTSAVSTDSAWRVNVSSGRVSYDLKSHYCYVWPVRGGR